MSGSSLFTATLEQAINRYLLLDARSEHRLAQLSGKKIAMELTGVDIRMMFGVSTGGVQLLHAGDGEPDARLSGTPLAFASLSLSDNPGKALLEGGVRLEGDSTVGQDFGDLLGKVDIDWEELLSHVLGDPLAHQLGNLLRGANDWARRATGSLRSDLGEYLQEESRDLPTTGEVESLLNGIDGFRSDVDRLEARLRRLQNRLNNAQSGDHE